MKQVLVLIALSVLLFACQQKIKTVKITAVKIDTATVLKGSLKVGDYNIAMHNIIYFERKMKGSDSIEFKKLTDSVQMQIEGVILKGILDTTVNPILKINSQDTTITYN